MSDMVERTPRQKADNAIKWIDTLPDYPQAPRGSRGQLGNYEMGFCCLGTACHTLGIDYEPENDVSSDFAAAVGMNTASGRFKGFNLFFRKRHLTDVNDSTLAGFKGIAKLLKTKPHWVFEKEVADLIKENYS